MFFKKIKKIIYIIILLAMIAPFFPKLALSEKWHMLWAIFRLPSTMIEDFYREINPPPYIREFSIQIKPGKTHYFEINTFLKKYSFNDVEFIPKNISDINNKSYVFFGVISEGVLEKYRTMKVLTCNQVKSHKDNLSFFIRNHINAKYLAVNSNIEGVMVLFDRRTKNSFSDCSPNSIDRCPNLLSPLNIETDDFEKNTYLTSVQKRVENGEDICRAYFR